MNCSQECGLINQSAYVRMIFQLILDVHVPGIFNDVPVLRFTEQPLCN